MELCIYCRISFICWSEKRYLCIDLWATYWFYYYDFCYPEFDIIQVISMMNLLYYSYCIRICHIFPETFLCHVSFLYLKESKWVLSSSVEGSEKTIVGLTRDCVVSPRGNVLSGYLACCYTMSMYYQLFLSLSLSLSTRSPQVDKHKHAHQGAKSTPANNYCVFTLSTPLFL